MTKEKDIRYKKAYTELNEIFKVLDKEQKSKIPDIFINNIINNMDKEYKFIFDNSKGIFEQDLMIETQALLVEIYERYLAPTEEKELWQKYDRFCLNKIEEKKKENYKDIFSNDKTTINTQNDNIQNNLNIIPVKNESKISKILKFIKNIFNKK